MGSYNNNLKVRLQSNFALLQLLGSKDLLYCLGIDALFDISKNIAFVNLKKRQIIFNFIKGKRGLNWWFYLVIYTSYTYSVSFCTCLKCLITLNQILINLMLTCFALVCS